MSSDVQQDERLNEILLEYYRRLDEGEAVDTEELCRQYPDWADELRELLDAEAAVCQLTDVYTESLATESVAPIRLPVRDYVQRILDLELIPKRTLWSIAREVRRDSPSDFDAPTFVDELAERLIEQELLTPWQHEQILRGQTALLSLKKYRVLRPVGSGGMGRVFLAQHVHMKRLVAIKVLPEIYVENRSYLSRFLAEAQSVAALNHPNIVQAYECDNIDDLHYLAMEYIEGEDLEKLVRRDGPLPAEEAVDYTLQAAKGLAYAHEHGIIHRDIKPSNLLLGVDGVIKLLDLGLALNLQESQSLTIKHGEQILGTTDYMSPEQALDSHAVDSRTDVYSLGGTLYFLLAGHPPFPGGTMADKLLRHQSVNPEPLGTVRPEIPPNLVAICEQMMSKRPEDRYETLHEVVAALANYDRPPSASSLQKTFAAKPAQPKAAAIRPWGFTWLYSVGFLLVVGLAMLAARYSGSLFAPSPPPANREPFWAGTEEFQDEFVSGEVSVVEHRPQNVFVQAATGLMACEAEDFFMHTGRGKHRWQKQPHPKAVGTTMAAVPNSGTQIDPAARRFSAELQYRVYFHRTGPHYLWIRGFAEQSDDGSVMTGLDNRPAGHAAGMERKLWSKSGPLHVESVGFHTVSLWMRHDGAAVDRLLVTPDANYAPRGEGPPESDRLPLHRVRPGRELVVGGEALSFAAEAFHESIGRGGIFWQRQPSLTRPGSAMQAVPDDGVSVSQDHPSQAPELVYRVRFLQPGKYVVWVHGHAPRHADDGCLVGWDGMPECSLSGFTGKWRWRSRTKPFVVEKPGVHTLHLWMRQDGFLCDRLLITDDPEFVPAETQPPLPASFLADRFGQRPPGLVRKFSIAGMPRDLALSLDEQQVAVARAGHSAAAIDLQTGELEKNIASAAVPVAEQVAVLPSGRHWALSDPNGVVHLVDTETAQVIRLLRGQGPLHQMSLLDEGRTLATAGERGIIQLWEIESGRRQRLRTRPATAVCAALSPDGTSALSGSEAASDDAQTAPQPTLLLWQLPGRAEPVPLGENLGPVRAVAFSPDGQSGASAGEDGWLRIWDLVKQQEVQRLPCPKGPVSMVKYLDAEHILAATTGGLELFDADGKQPIWQGPHPECTSAAVSRDGRFAVTGGADQTLRLWRLPEPSSRQQPVR